MILFSSEETLLRLESCSRFYGAKLLSVPKCPLQHVIVTRHGFYVYTASPLSTLIRGKVIGWLFVSLASFPHQIAVYTEAFHQGECHRMRADELHKIPQKNMEELLVHFHAKIKLWKNKTFFSSLQKSPKLGKHPNVPEFFQTSSERPTFTNRKQYLQQAHLLPGRVTSSQSTGNSWNDRKVGGWLRVCQEQNRSSEHCHRGGESPPTLGLG